MKKTLAVAMALILLMLLAVGCTSNPSAPASNEATDDGAVNQEDGGENQEAELDINEDGTVNNPEDIVVEEGTLTFWSLFGGGDGEFMAQIVDDYNATNPTMPVYTVVVPDYYTKLQTAVAADKGPDIGVSHVTKLPELIGNGALEPITGYIDSVGVNLDDYNLTAREAVNIDGETWALPLDSPGMIMYYNIDLLNEAGIPLEADGTVKVDSWDHFISLLEQAKSVLGEGQSAMAFPYSGDLTHWVWWAIYNSMGGGSFFDENETAITMDREIAAQAMDAMRQLYADELILPGIENAGQLFQSGDAAFTWDGTWRVGVYESTEGLNYGAMVLPTPFEQDASFADIHTLVLPVKNDRTEEVGAETVEFLSYVTSTGTEKWMESGQVPAYLPTVEGEAFNALPHRTNYKGYLDIAIIQPYPIYGAIHNAVTAGVGDALAGNVDSATAVENIYAEVESLLY